MKTADPKTSRLSDVRHFMDTFRQPYPCENKDRIAWIIEEATELMAAVCLDDMVGMLDANIDIAYIHLGGVLERGGAEWSLISNQAWSLIGQCSARFPDEVRDAAWQIVHQRNMAKVWTRMQVLAVHGPRILDLGWQESNGIRIDVHPVGEHFAVLRNGKVSKPPGWTGPEPELRALLIQAGIIPAAS